MNLPLKPTSRPQFVISLPSSSQFQPPTRLTADNRITIATRTKVRIGLTPRVASRIHSRPTHSPSPSLHRPLTEARPNPSLSNLFKANVLVTRLSTATQSPDKRQTHPVRPTVSWAPYRRKALLTSVIGSSVTLNSGKDLELVVLSRSSALAAQPLTEVQPRDMVLNLSTESEHPKTKKKAPHSSLSLPPPYSKATGKVEEKVAVKEAFRDFEWLGKARDQLGKDWAKYLRLSNGLAVDAPSEAFFTYKYYLGRGNNHNLVKACFRSRGMWSRLKLADDQSSANLVWTQSKSKLLFKTFPQVHTRPHPQPSQSSSIICSVKLSTKKIPGQSVKTVDITSLGYDLITQSESFTFVEVTNRIEAGGLRTHNKLEHNYHLSNKKTLFFSMRTYYRLIGKDPFSMLPLTFHIKDGPSDPEYHRFLHVFQQIERKQEWDENGEPLNGRNIWIIKPGENTNRGTGINVYSTLDEIRAEVSCRTTCPVSGQKRTFILQKYIENPLLIHKRKFDIRGYGLLTAINGVVQGYYYKEGYLRTSSTEFDLGDVSNRFIHLTNDAVQKYSEDYGRFESGNKLSYSDFQRYIDSHYPSAKVSVARDILPQIRQIVKDTFAASFAKVNSDQRLFSFEVLGYDFMVDANMKVWLIEVNTNPCLELSSPLLARIIPAMLDNAFRIAVDPYFPEVQGQKRPYTSLTGEALPENRFELVFHSLVEGARLRHQLGDEKFRSLEEFDRTLQDMPEEEEMEESESSDEGC